MAWYWWLLIAVGVIAIGALKMVVLKRWQEKKRAAQRAQENEDE